MVNYVIITLINNTGKYDTALFLTLHLGRIGRTVSTLREVHWNRGRWNGPSNFISCSERKCTYSWFWIGFSCATSV